jgi:hypothetical protein
VGVRCADHSTASIRWSSPTSGGRSVGIVRLRTKSHGFCFFVLISEEEMEKTWEEAVFIKFVWFEQSSPLGCLVMQSSRRPLMSTETKIYQTNNEQYLVRTETARFSERHELLPEYMSQIPEYSTLFLFSHHSDNLKFHMSTTFMPQVQKMAYVIIYLVALMPPRRVFSFVVRYLATLPASRRRWSSTLFFHMLFCLSMSMRGEP